MAFFAVLTLVPLTIAIGGLLVAGWLSSHLFAATGHALDFRSGGVAADDPSVQIIGQSVNAVVATVIWAYLASIAILLGGELNALLRARRSRA